MEDLHEQCLDGLCYPSPLCSDFLERVRVVPELAGPPPEREDQLLVPPVCNLSDDAQRVASLPGRSWAAGTDAKAQPGHNRAQDW